MNNYSLESKKKEEENCHDKNLLPESDLENRYIAPLGIL